MRQETCPRPNIPTTNVRTEAAVDHMDVDPPRLGAAAPPPSSPAPGPVVRVPASFSTRVTQAAGRLTIQGPPTPVPGVRQASVVRRVDTGRELRSILHHRVSTRAQSRARGDKVLAADAPPPIHQIIGARRVQAMGSGTTAAETSAHPTRLLGGEIVALLSPTEYGRSDIVGRTHGPLGNGFATSEDPRGTVSISHFRPKP